jgi:hypothetical protein
VPNLSFQVEGAAPTPHAATPQLALKLRVANAEPDEAIHSIALQCQIHIEAPRRRYAAEEQDRLFDLFGPPGDWSRTLRGLLWTQTQVYVGGFRGDTRVDVPVPCSTDFTQAAAKYVAALDDGEVPLCLLFSGSIFYAAPEGNLQIAQIPWDLEATYRLPVQVWRELIDLYYPHTRWLTLREDVFDRLLHFKSRRGLPTWEQTLETLLAQAETRQAVP